MIDLYKEISGEILKALSYANVDEYEIEKKLDQRQALIDNLSEKELESFILDYKKGAVYELDKEIKVKLAEAISDVKNEIRQYKTKKAVNTAYVNVNKNNLNLFLKKV